jgi:hypothetical protein
MCSERVNNSFSKYSTYRVTLLTNPMVSHQWGQDQPHGGDFISTTRNPWFSYLLVSSNPLIKEIMIWTTSSEISDQPRDIHSINLCCWNVDAYKWVNWKHLFCRKGLFLSAPIVNIEVYVKVWSRPSGICGIISSITIAHIVPIH